MVRLVGSAVTDFRRSVAGSDSRFVNGSPPGLWSCVAALSHGEHALLAQCNSAWPVGLEYRDLRLDLRVYGDRVRSNGQLAEGAP